MGPRAKHNDKKHTPEQKEHAKQIQKLKIEEKRKKKIERQYYDSIEQIFKYSGFVSLPVEGCQFNIDNRPNCELDHCFVSENIIVICEHTTGQKNPKHLLGKQETANVILRNNIGKTEFLNHLTTQYSRLFNMNKFGISRWKIFYLYFSKERIVFDESDKLRYDKLKFIDIGTYNYFYSISKCIKKSFKYEILRFLNIDYTDYGPVVAGSGTPLPQREVSIIYPNDVTGLNCGVGVVSFMMSPQELIKTSYVLRKDNWEEKIGLYQRLITGKRIKSIRHFIVETKRTFFNNIIVGLPDTVKIYDENENEIAINDLDRYKNCKMRLTEGFNTLCIIDGQHRVYAYYENDNTNTEEVEVSLLRNKLNLLVTGVLFPREWTDFERLKFQSEIFLQINKNSKNVDKDILIHIESTKDSFSALSIARRTLEKMNKLSPFNNMFELSLVEKAPIKVTSIIQYALSNLVTPDIKNCGLYKYWVPSGGVEKPERLEDDRLLLEYVDYCARILSQYFNAIKTKFPNYWVDPKSQILKIISINGFIISLYHSLRLTDGGRDYGFYLGIFDSLFLDFSKDKFPYAGSRYSQFAVEMIDPLFFKECEEKYLDIIELPIGATIAFRNNSDVEAIASENHKFKYKNIEYTLHELTKVIEKKDVLNDFAGKYWIYLGSCIHDIYEENK